MSDETKTKNGVVEGSAGPDGLTGRVDLDPAKAGAANVPLPGVVAIALYMLVLSAVVTFGAIGKHLPMLFLLLAPFFVTASFGLLRMFRWAWALTMAAVFLLMTYNLWLFFMQKQAPGAVQGVLNMLFFLYLVREDVRKRLR